LNKLLIYGLLLLAVATVSCKQSEGKKEGGQVILPSSTGKMGEMVMVIDPMIWEGSAGAMIKEKLMTEKIGLPQVEPMFHVVHIPKKAFSNIFKTHRNLIITERSDTNYATFSNNVWAEDQKVLFIFFKDEKGLASMFRENGAQWALEFEKEEFVRLQKSYRKAPLKELMPFLKAKEIALQVPRDFRINIQEDGFVWLFRDKREITQGILIYETGLYDDDRIFDRILEVRDSITEMYVEGELPNTFMQVEMQYSPSMTGTTVSNMFAVDTRGLWRMKNDFMGGPFVSVSVLDEVNSRVITVDAFVYAPGKDKRNLMWELEAVIQSLKLSSGTALNASL
jgi:hypothetical protein